LRGHRLGGRHRLETGPPSVQSDLKHSDPFGTILCGLHAACRTRRSVSVMPNRLPVISARSTSQKSTWYGSRRGAPRRSISRWRSGGPPRFHLIGVVPASSAFQWIAETNLKNALVINVCWRCSTCAEPPLDGGRVCGRTAAQVLEYPPSCPGWSLRNRDPDRDFDRAADVGRAPAPNLDVISNISANPDRTFGVIRLLLMLTGTA